MANLNASASIFVSGKPKQQLICDNAELDLSGLDFLKIHGATWGKNYNIISIIGSQSSGKSTLLNHLFGTAFDVMRAAMRQQTTKGIWISVDKENPFLIMDVEGSDSKERWDQRNFYEQSTALFGLALSQVFLINLWHFEIGRFGASQYGTLKVIFEMNIKLFKQDSTKEILFIVRDFSCDEDLSPDQVFKDLSLGILKDVEKIWDEINKPPELKNYTPDRLFKISFYRMHALREKKMFLDDVQTLRRAFFTDSTSRDYLFKDFSYETNLPFDALPLYVEKVWGTIKSNKDLNLPSQKVMVANLRCSQIKLEALEEIKNDIISLKKSINNGIYNEFGSDGRNILKNAINYFENNAKDYAIEVFQEKIKELESMVLNDLFQLYEIQIRNIKKKVSSDFSEKLDTLQLEKGKMNQVMATLKQLKSETMEVAVSMVKNSVVNSELWEMDETLKEIKETFENQEKGYVEKLLTLFIKFKETQLKRQLERSINSFFDELNQDFWVKVKEVYFKVTNTCEEEVLNILKESFALNQNSSAKYIDQLKDEVYQSVEYEIQKKCQDLNYYLMKKFKVAFSRNENGTPRNWRIINEEEIERIFMAAKDLVVALLKMFKVFELDKTVTATSTDIFERRQSALERECASLLNESDYQKINNKLIEDTDYEYKEALRKHNAKDSGGVPRWFWLVLIFFMYDDVLRWMGSWYMIYPFMILMTFIGFSYAIGYGDLPKVVFEGVFSKINSMFGNKLMGLALRIGLK